MRILQVTNFFKPVWEAGGVARASYEISKNLLERGHYLTVYTTNYSLNDMNLKTNRQTNLEGMKVFYFENFRKYFPFKIIPLPLFSLFVIRKNIKKFDVIHLHENRTLLSVIVYYFAKKNNIPYIVQSHGSLLQGLGKSFSKKIFDKCLGNKILHNASKVIALNEVEVDTYLNKGIPREKIEIIPNGINLEEYQHLPESGNFREKNGISDNEKIILYLGRIHKRKRVEILIEAFKLVLNDYNSKLVIVGPDAGHNANLTELVSKIGIESNVLFTGPLYGKSKSEAYIDADVFVYPSVLEIFGLSQLESLLCGTPIIVSDDCGCGNMINEGLGYTFKEGDVEDLTDKILFILQNYVEGICMVDDAKQYIKENFDSNVIGKKFEVIYYSIKINNE